MASIFGGAFHRMPQEMQRRMAAQIVLRKKNHCSGLAGNRWGAKAILVGDRPGNAAKLLPANHHHTPFFSTKNSSFWLNRLLLDANIHENDLFWLNSADLNGMPANPSHLIGWGHFTAIIALGGNAEKWLQQNNVHPDAKVFHPQAWKRFRSGEEYPLVQILTDICST